MRSATDRLRLISIPHLGKPEPASGLDASAAWQAADPKSVRPFSAACYFMGREVQATQNVPVGLIHASWGGTAIEPWLAPVGVVGRASPTPWRSCACTPATKTRPTRPSGERGKPGGASTATARRGQPEDAGPWAAVPALTNWKTWGVPETATLDGMVWFRRSVDLTAAQAAQPATLALGGIDEVDQTWVNGRILRNTFGWGTRRTYRLPAGMLHAGPNALVLNVLSTYDAGGLLGPADAMALTLADGTPDTARRWLALPRRPARGRAATACPLGDAPRRDHALQRDDRAPRPVPAPRGRLVSGREQHRYGVRVRVASARADGGLAGAVRRSGAAVPDRSAPQFRRRAHRAGRIGLGQPARGAAPRRRRRSARRPGRDDRHRRSGRPAPGQQARRRPAVGARRPPRRLRRRHSPVGAGRAVGAPRTGRRRRDLRRRDRHAWSPTAPTWRSGSSCAARRAGTCRYVAGRVDGNRVVLPLAAGPAPTRVRFCWGQSPLANLSDGSELPAGPFELAIDAAIVRVATRISGENIERARTLAVDVRPCVHIVRRRRVDDGAAARGDARPAAGPV